jgi:hypothetical protein
MLFVWFLLPWSNALLAHASNNRVGNTVPVANAGKDTIIYKNQTRPDSASLNGRASSGETYRWEFLNGPTTPVIQTPDSLTSWVTGITEGSYQFRLTVDGAISDTMVAFVRDWQKKGVYPCRSGYDTTAKTGGLKIVLEPNYKGTYLKSDGTSGTWNQWNYILDVRSYIQSTKKITLYGGDTLLMQGADSTVWVELGGFGGSKGCPVYIMPKTKPVRIRGVNSFFRIATRDSNVVQHVVVDGTALRNDGYPYGFILDNSGIGYTSNGPFNGGWLANFILKGVRSKKTNALKIKLDPNAHAFSRYDKFIQKNIVITDNWIDSSSVEGMYIGSTASDGGQLSNPYGPPPRMDSVEISNNVVTNCAWDGIQLANAKNGCVIKHNLVNKVGTANMASQRAGILMGGNSTGVVDSNIVINSKGNGIQVFGYGDVQVYNNIIDSIYGGKGDQDGMYQSFILFTSEPNVSPLRMYNYNNLIGRIERSMIRVANNNGKMLPGRTHHNTFIHPSATNANSLIVTYAKDVLDNNSIVSSFPYKLNAITTQGAGMAISMTQGDTTQTFASTKATLNWLFKRLNGVTPANMPPVVTVDADRRISPPEDSALLSGHAADEDGSIKSYQWTQLSGPDSILFQTPNQPQTLVKDLHAGSYTFELAATDNGNGIGRDTMTVTVNIPPVVNAGKDTTINLPVNRYLLKGTASDKDGTLNAIQWTKLSGPETFVLQNSTTLEATADSLRNGVYVFELRVFDNDNSPAADTVVLIVNMPPASNAGADTMITLPANSVILKGSGTDTDGTVIRYKWTQLGGPNVAVVGSPDQLQTALSGMVGGLYSFELAITDDRMAVGKDTVKVTVNAPPSVNAGTDQTITLPTNSVTLKGIATDADGTITTYNWTKISGPAQGSIGTPNAATTVVSGLVAGSYVFSLAVTDNNGITASDAIAITVNSSAVTTSKTINVNIYGGASAYNNSVWNNWSIKTKNENNVTSAAYIYSDGTASTVNATLSNSANIADNGTTYGSGMAPAPVLRYTSYYNSNRTLTIKGLQVSKKYNIDLYASRNVSGSATIFTINGVSKTINTYNNLNTKASYTNLTASSTGQIVITIAKSGSFNCINGFSMTELSTATTSITTIGSEQVLVEEAPTATDQVDLFPNPANANLLLRVNNHPQGVMTVRVLSATGMLVKHWTFIKGQQQMQQLLPIQDLPSGVYFMRLQIGTWVTSKKFEKH